MPELNQKHIALFISSMRGGGAERVTLNLGTEFAKLGHKVDLILVTKEGPYLKEVPEYIRVLSFFVPFRKRFRTLLNTFPLAIYLRREKPDVVLSAMNHCNVVALIAKILSGAKTRAAISEHNTFSIAGKTLGFFKRMITPKLMRLLYPKADTIIAVSKNVADDLAQSIGIPRERIEVIYNPVISPEIYEKAKEKINHPYFPSSSLKIIIGVGRLTEQKDFPTLIKAFAKVKQKIDANLIILGEGEDRKKLEKLIENLNLKEYIDLPGFVKNPYAFMAKADLFVLSSKWEGLPTTLIEAMACGTPVVSTDCPSGPAEILENGKYGKLVPVGDVEALAEAMEEALDNPIDPVKLQERAGYFSAERAISGYLEVMNI